MRRLVWVPVLTISAVLLLAVGGALWARGQLRGSLPQLDGQRRLPGLSAQVDVSRDALGVPTIRGRSRADVARATGFLHAQDRYFQMDLSRRRAAGELAALVGSRAFPLDRDVRIHRFRAEARRAFSLLGTDDRLVLEAYADGVNAGLQALSSPPFEYLLLRQTPLPWTPEDSFLVVLSMFLTLQDDDGEYEATLATMSEVLPPAMVEFLSPRGSEWDAPLVGEPFAVPPVPGPEVYDLRGRRTGKPPRPVLPPLGPISDRDNQSSRRWSPGVGHMESEAAAIGSNNFAVSGRLTADGGALVANDMHLSIRVPNTWYRVSLEWPNPNDAAGPNHLIGVTLPGAPTLVVGSNTHVAWGFTNTYADWSDIVLLDVDPSRPNAYRTPEGWRAFERHDETIAVAGEPDAHLRVLWTIWGPVLEPDHRGRPRAYRWVAHSAEQLAVSLTPLEASRTIEEALDAANGLGTPGQNLVVADRNGRIAWSIYGSIPRRVGFDGQLPSSWSDGTRRWDGWLTDAEYPRVVDPAGGRIWTANARTVNGEMLDALGDGGYEIGSRARLIRDRLLAKNRFAPRDLLAIQLDTSADFLERWRDLILSTLSIGLAHDANRAELRDILENGWSGKAAADSAAYRLTRSFRDTVSNRVIEFVLVECYEADATFDYTTIRRRDAAIWTIVNERPQHLLDPQYATWTDFLTEAVDAAIEQAMRGDAGRLRDRVWSEFNVAAFRHPLSAGLPFVGRLLDMPIVALPGDLYTPRMHWGAIGASERMVVSPGREAEGIMHMPTGQSGHPLSPFYANSHPAWLAGDATPFLPGSPVHSLTLTP
jgi:penicillin amidase